jgi:hypothetical protein
MLVLIGCESSGAVREAFRRRGHDAWSCDLQPADDGSPHHLQCDVRDAITARRWDLGIFHPPCTRLTNSGVRWLEERQLWAELKEGADLFLDCLHADIPRVAVENPIPHGHAMALIKAPYTQIIQPWQFGHGETKATCLWLKGLPELVPTDVVPGREARIHWMPPSDERWKLRSQTYAGIADAMADQWGRAALDLVTQMEAA